MCLLSGGESRRMGRDKALLPHPDGGVWLTALVEQLQPLSLPLQLLTRHQAHADLFCNDPSVEVLMQPPPWRGPLHALGWVLPADSNQALLVLPVDMPRITTAVLGQLIKAWHQQPQTAAVAHDGRQLQPLFSVIPSGSPFQSTLLKHLQAGRLRWLDWLNQVPFQEVALPAQTLLNVNCPEDLAALRG